MGSATAIASTECNAGPHRSERGWCTVDPMIGKLGTAYLSIAAGGFGEVVLNVDGSTQLYVATSAVDIARDDNILVIGRTDDGTLVVDKWFPAPNTPAPHDI